jgi:hypothetical protein
VCIEWWGSDASLPCLFWNSHVVHRGQEPGRRDFPEYDHDLLGRPRHIGFGTNIRSKDADGMTPILYTCSSGKWKLVKYLLAHGSNVLLEVIYSQRNNCLQWI